MPAAGHGASRALTLWPRPGCCAQSQWVIVVQRGAAGHRRRRRRLSSRLLLRRPTATDIDPVTSAVIMAMPCALFAFQCIQNPEPIMRADYSVFQMNA